MRSRSDRRVRRPGFKIIELMAVIAIVGLLIGLALPAIQSSREEARRASCRSNLKQIGMALYQYNAEYQVFVPGHIVRVDGGPPPASSRDGQMLSGDRDIPWLVLMLRQLDQPSLYNGFNFELGTEGPASQGYPGFFANTTVFATKISLFQCPSDRVESFRFQPSFAGARLAVPTITKGNYAASWGNTGWDQLNLTDPLVPYLTSPFGHSTRTISMVTDGLSNTVFFAEVRQGALNDIRGASWMSVAGAGSFSSRLTPNGRSDYYRRDPSGADQLPHPTLCISESAMPCTGLSGQGKAFAGPRSRHQGGVYVLMGDGSVSFVKDSIEPSRWIALNSTEGYEVLSDSSY
jgi:prepilin-type processing-associated H-X9-DG protein